MYVTNVCFVAISTFCGIKLFLKSIYISLAMNCYIEFTESILNVNFYGYILCKVKTNRVVLGGFVFP